MNDSFITLLRDRLACPVTPEVPLSPLNTFGIGGPAACVVSPHSVEDVCESLAVCREEGKCLYVLGAGSNVIVPDEGIDGVVLHLGDTLSEISLENGVIRAAGGVLDGKLSEFAWGHQLTGFEWIFDIPGSIGGAVYMNAGNNDGEISETVTQVTWVGPDGSVQVSQLQELELGYRRSRFHGSPGIIVEALFEPLGSDDPADIRDRMDSIQAVRQSKFPPETLCAGSIFKRPPGHFAGRLIEEAGCGGMCVGGALVSQKHKGFIVNTGDATATDVLELIARVKARVLADSGVTLTTEVVSFEPFLSF
jgi:UDP-N-acetylmuramate dehydrogenase